MVKKSKFSFSCSSNLSDVNGMLYYLNEFDPIAQKYDFDNNMTVAARAIISKFEGLQQFGNLTKYEFSDIIKNLQLVYWDKDVIRKDIMAYYLVEEKVIHQYLAIPQLDRLFDEDYFNFEWDMHVGQNFNEHRCDYYRDHFIHQIRDMYMMLILMTKFDFYEASYKILKDQSVGKISDYTYKKWCQFEDNKNLPQRLLLDEVINKIPELAKSKEKNNLYVEKYFFHYVIYASSMLAALFHDMGYPICHFLEVRHRISDYNPFMYMFTHNAVDSFDELAAKLRDSLLFTIVSSHEIKSALQIGKNGRYNHGAYSSIAFLLQFYENGIIFSLSPEKQCAIELAALAIYNHTVKFDVLEYNEKNSYCLPVFNQNPVTFLLRFCDDLQEWDRRYFEISSASDFTFCQNCGAPMLIDLNQSTSRSGDSYICLCKNIKIPQPQAFVKRNLFLVTVTDTVDLIYPNDDSNRILTAKLNYDLYKLLLLSSINNSYAKHRAKELRDLKKLVSNQNYSFLSAGSLPFDNIKLDYFMSANPLLIKLKILEKYLEKKGIHKTTTDEIYRIIIKYLSDVPVDKRIKANLRFYIKLLLDCRRAHNFIEESFIKKFNDYIPDKDPSYVNALCNLVCDCYEQYKIEKDMGDNPFENEKTYDFYCNQYVNDKNKGLYYAISLFTNQKSRCNQYSNFDKKYIGYYADILIFYWMNKEIS